MLERGTLIRLDARTVAVAACVPEGEDRWRLFFTAPDDRGGATEQAVVSPGDVEVLSEDGAASSEEVLAALSTAHMASAASSSEARALISSQLVPYAHQYEAVYRTMLPQPRLRFLLGDEPGTGKTIMGGLYAREAQRLGRVSRCLVVCPAHLVSKWQADFERFLGGGLERIESDSVSTTSLSQKSTFARLLGSGSGFWVVSLELAAANPSVLEAIAPDVAGWDLVIVDEAHRMTPTAETFYAVGNVLKEAPRFVAMTATPHRGNERFFRALMHLVDPDIYPEVTDTVEPEHRLQPGRTHLLRRMKEELYDRDGVTRLFNDRHAQNLHQPLSPVEFDVYESAQRIVNEFFPDEARTLGRMVYGKRAASSLYGLAKTLRRRQARMGTATGTEAVRDSTLVPDQDDEAAKDDAKVVTARSKNKTEERRRIKVLVEQIEGHLNDPSHAGPRHVASKWGRMVDDALVPNGITPDGDEQLVVFTEYADTAEWLVDQFEAEGFTAERYSGRDDRAERDRVRRRFMAGEFQVIVSTDAGNEGIDLQSARVLVNWDIPWSLVTLEQRMGRIHRIGQKHDVALFNLIAPDALEGRTYGALLDKLVGAANEMGGKMFDCLSLVGQAVLDGADDTRCTVPLSGMFSDNEESRRAAASAIDAISQDQLRIAAEETQRASEVLNTPMTDRQREEANTLILDDTVDRLTPAPINFWLSRLDDAGLLNAAPAVLSADAMRVVQPTGRFDLPAQLACGPTGRLVATDGQTKRDLLEAGQAEAGDAVELVPGAPAFTALVDSAAEALRPALVRGGAAHDESSLTDYTLLLFETPVSAGPPGSQRRALWRTLVHYDGVDAAVVPFGVLANLAPSDASARVPDELAKERARRVAEEHATARRDERAAGRRESNREVRRQLSRLPGELVRHLSGDAKRQTSQRVREAVEQRMRLLESDADATLGETTLVGWVQVTGNHEPLDPNRATSEEVAVKHVAERLTAARWHVSDVQRDGLGYDLKARRAQEVRAVEVKGVWGAASSDGIKLTGNEVLQAQKLGSDYWLYVVHQCHDLTGELYGAWADPHTVFGDLTHEIAAVRIAGSDLKANRHIGDAA